MLYEELSERGLVFQETSPEIRQVLEKPTTFYIGFDPTSDSLHVGSLLPLITMRRLQQHGHRPIVLLGGATGMIGDPSGKSQERVLITPEIVLRNIEGIRKNAEKVIDFAGPNAALLVNNMDWMGSFSYIDFLRDVGKHFSVNAMLAKDSVKDRLQNRDHGISYTEFSYMLLQSYDFFHLYKEHNCRLQMGGSDQWGNITSGVDLIRRLQGDKQDKDICFGLTYPLVTKADGSKFGKSESGNVWLSPAKTSPYQFYQFFINLPDNEVTKLLRYFSLKPLSEIKELETRFQQEPHRREAQKSLAQELTTLLHGEGECLKAQKATEALFVGDFSQVDRETLDQAFQDVPSCELPSSQVGESSLVDILVLSGLCSSKGAARKDFQAGAIYLEGEKLSAALSDKTLNQLAGALTVTLPELKSGEFLVLRRGKKNYCLVRIV